MRSCLVSSRNKGQPQRHESAAQRDERHRHHPAVGSVGVLAESMRRRRQVRPHDVEDRDAGEAAQQRRDRDDSCPAAHHVVRKARLLTWSAVRRNHRRTVIPSSRWTAPDQPVCSVRGAVMAAVAAANASVSEIQRNLHQRASVRHASENSSIDVMSRTNATTDALLWMDSSNVSGTRGRSTSNTPAAMRPVPARARRTGMGLATPDEKSPGADRTPGPATIGRRRRTPPS